MQMTLKQRLSFHVNRLINDGGEVVTEIPPKIKAWRQPTNAEISFGYGAIIVLAMRKRLRMVEV